MVTESVLRCPRRGASSDGVLGELERGVSVNGLSWGMEMSVAFISSGFVTGEEFPDSVPVPVPT